jgi:hypothetical protein
MHFHDVNSDLLQDDSLNAENSQRQQESLTRLQYLIAFLTEKNEQMRQQLIAASHEERSNDNRRRIG